MPWVPRSKPDRAKLRAVPADGDRRARRLACGHETDAEPIATTHGRRFYRCPDGCGLQRGR